MWGSCRDGVQVSAFSTANKECVLSFAGPGR